MRSDYGFDESTKMLNNLERKIKKEYAQAYKEMSQKANRYFAQFEKEDAKMHALYKNGEITRKEYGAWRTRKMLTGDKWQAMKYTLADDLTNADKIAMQMVNGQTVDCYALNRNFETYSIEHETGINTSFTLYNHKAVENLIKNEPQLLPKPAVNIPKDMRWNMSHIQSAITQGILQGESINKVATRLQAVTNMDEHAAIRNARTAMTGAQNAGRIDSMNEAKEKGIGLKKGWMATLDSRTRDSHALMDGETVEIGEAFSNGLMYPADPSGDPAEVYNCRCRMTHEYDRYQTDWSNTALRNDSKLKGMTYDEWKESHKKE